MRTFTGLDRVLHRSYAVGIFEHVFDSSTQPRTCSHVIAELPDAPTSCACVCSSTLESLELHPEFDADFEAHFGALIDDAPLCDVAPDLASHDLASHGTDSPQGRSPLTKQMRSRASFQERLDAINSLHVGPIAMMQLAAIDVGRGRDARTRGVRVKRCCECTIDEFRIPYLHPFGGGGSRTPKRCCI